MTLEQLLGDKVQDKAGTLEVSSLKEKKKIGLYFSAHWCPPCRGFTPKLVEWYNMIKDEEDDGDDMEIVFVSSDKDQQAFDDYYSDMPWKAVPFANRTRKEDLCKTFGVTGIPTLVFLDGDGQTITKDGRTLVSSGKKLCHIK